MKSEALWVKTASKQYPIHFTQKPAGAIFGELLADFPNKKVAVITDTNLARPYQREIEGAFRKAGRELHFMAIQAGEKSKTRRMKERLEDALLALKFDRACLLVAFGGGVVGDLVGYTAATLLRGVAFVQIPTSLLAMVDSSVGGKTGVDTPHGKNLVGAFWQPEAVYVGLELLKTLPQGEFRQGLAEVLKYGFIQSPALDRLLEKQPAAILARKASVLLPVIHQSLAIKRDVVGKDERETGGLRRILNFGHTAGHAVELLSRYRLSHGLCVAIGMAVEADVSVRLGFMKAKEAEAVAKRLLAYGLPARVPKTMGFEALYGAMLSDKKSNSDAVKMTLLSKIGSCAKGPAGDYAVAVPKPVLAQAFAALRE